MSRGWNCLKRGLSAFLRCGMWSRNLGPSSSSQFRSVRETSRMKSLLLLSSSARSLLSRLLPLVLAQSMVTCLSEHGLWPIRWFIGGRHFRQAGKLRERPRAGQLLLTPMVRQPLKFLLRNPRRADDLLVEYTEPLFRSRRTPATNILHVHESQPFEAYRQLLGAMQRYQRSLQVLGGSRLVVTPLSSKLITLGAGLASFEMRT